ncbi:hypothetical protein Bca52824_045749 [Brassica carinata]|uniref:Uncharacterized protein n=1 Tax=Brassica carinata TaxID=52824 RepID=A0A8X7RD45_BRACI|nr:hypothetical protein Bca52824_045749 [Brassica carinata]
MSTFLSCAYRKKGQWAFNVGGVVLPSPSTSAEESLAYFNSNGLDVWYMTTFLGVETVAIDAAKDMVTVKGTMDVKELVSFLANSSNEPSTFSSGQIDDSATSLAVKEEIPATGAKEGKIEVKFERRKQRVARRRKNFLTA